MAYKPNYNVWAPLLVTGLPPANLSQRRRTSSCLSRVNRPGRNRARNSQGFATELGCAARTITMVSYARTKVADLTP